MKTPLISVEISDALGQTYSKIGIPERESNLRDQWSVHASTNGSYNGHAETSPPTRPKIHSLHIFPLKSCHGIELDEATVLPKGLEHDRVFCLAQRKMKKQPGPGATAAEPHKAAASAAGTEYWEVLTLRQIAPMANIKVDLWLPDGSKQSRQLSPIIGEQTAGSSSPGENLLVARFPWRSGGIRGLIETMAAKLSRGLSAAAEREFMLPTSYPSAREVKARGYSHTEVTLFRNVITALNMGAEVPKELALYLGLEPGKLALFRLDPAQ